jgi:hypothetical protein
MTACTDRDGLEIRLSGQIIHDVAPRAREVDPLKIHPIKSFLSFMVFTMELVLPMSKQRGEFRKPL